MPSPRIDAPVIDFIHYSCMIKYNYQFIEIWWVSIILWPTIESVGSNIFSIHYDYVLRTSDICARGRPRCRAPKPWSHEHTDQMDFYCSNLPSLIPMPHFCIIFILCLVVCYTILSCFIKTLNLQWRHLLNPMIDGNNMHVWAPRCIVHWTRISIHWILDFKQLLLLFKQLLLLLLLISTEYNQCLLDTQRRECVFQNDHCLGGWSLIRKQDTRGNTIV